MMVQIRDKSDVVLIGGVAAGPKTAATLARRLPAARITLFQKEDHLSYASCGFPFFASGEIGSFEDLLKTSWGTVRDPDYFEKAKGFTAMTRAAVTSIDREGKTVTVEMLDTGETIIHAYDRLVIATGSAPNVPPMPVAASDRVGPFTRPADVLKFRRLAERGEIESVVIIGGGFIGVELCEAVKDMWGIEVTLFEKQPQLLPYMLDPEMAALVERSLVRDGVSVHVNAVVEDVTDGEGGAPGTAGERGATMAGRGKPMVIVAGREPLAADYVFLCLGVRPEVPLARECGLDIGETGGIAVNARLQTSDPDIYAGGDCIESRHRLTGRPIYLPLGSLANRHGRVIAENIAGHDAEFPGVLGAFMLRAFETHIGGVGLSEEAARAQGYDAWSVWGSFPDRPDYNPDVKTMTLKMVYERDTERLLGLQAVGRGDIARRVDVFSSLLQHEARIEDIFELEHGYAPPFSEALDPLHQLAGIAGAVKRGTGFVGPGTFASSFNGDTTILDVREGEEAANEPLPTELTASAGAAVTIPLGELRARHGELDPKRRYVVVCRRGPRSYQAALMLESLGFEAVDVLAAGLQAQM